MKKLLVTILALVYLTASVGATVHLHYCMDKLVSWGFAHEKSDKNSCPYCGMNKTAGDKHCSQESKGCCKDEQKQIKGEKDQKISENGFDVSKLAIQSVTHSSLTVDNVNVFTTSIEYPLTHAPPRSKTISLFVRNCVFRI